MPYYNCNSAKVAGGGISSVGKIEEFGYTVTPSTLLCTIDHFFGDSSHIFYIEPNKKYCYYVSEKKLLRTNISDNTTTVLFENMNRVNTNWSVMMVYANNKLYMTIDKNIYTYNFKDNTMSQVTSSGKFTAGSTRVIDNDFFCCPDNTTVTKYDLHSETSFDMPDAQLNWFVSGKYFYYYIADGNRVNVINIESDEPFLGDPFASIDIKYDIDVCKDVHSIPYMFRNTFTLPSDSMTTGDRSRYFSSDYFIDITCTSYIYTLKNNKLLIYSTDYSTIQAECFDDLLVMTDIDTYIYQLEDKANLLTLYLKESNEVLCDTDVLNPATDNLIKTDSGYKCTKTGKCELWFREDPEELVYSIV